MIVWSDVLENNDTLEKKVSFWLLFFVLVLVGGWGWKEGLPVRECVREKEGEK